MALTQDPDSSSMQEGGQTEYFSGKVPVSMTLPLVVCAAPLLKLPADMASVPVKGPGQGEGVCKDGGRGQETELGVDGLPTAALSLHGLRGLGAGRGGRDQEPGLGLRNQLGLINMEPGSGG